GLVRIERTPWFFGGQQWSAQTSQDDPLHLISPQVRAIRFRYLDGRDWKDRWDSVAQQALPTAVEVSLTWILTDGSESSPLQLAEEVRRFVIRLPQAS
ncbi:MAG TPA: type II secretion system protein GspJ, partial [Planctomycetaceae bacterium]|nr:type II secretion system protein GspJ [Planctomycetaceae bacterium]